MLALAEWPAPDFSISGFWTYVGATIVVWLVNVVMGWVLDKIRGTAPPRTSRSGPELDEQRPARDAVPGRDVHRQRVLSNGDATGISIFIASRITSGARAWTTAPCSTSTRRTVPGIGRRDAALAAARSVPLRRRCRQRAVAPVSGEGQVEAPRRPPGVGRADEAGGGRAADAR